MLPKVLSLSNQLSLWEYSTNGILLGEIWRQYKQYHSYAHRLQSHLLPFFSIRDVCQWVSIHGYWNWTVSATIIFLIFVINAFSLLFSTDYPTWMASDVDFKRLYLFKKPEGCCNKWFVTAVDACVNSIIQGKYDILPCPTNRPECNQTSSVTNATAEVLSKWYPSIWEFKCKNDQKMPEYMLIEGYREWYLFNSEEQCCASFGYCWVWIFVKKECSRETV